MWLSSCFLACVWLPLAQEGPQQAPGDHWPGFRGVGTSHSAAHDVPVSWSEEEGVAWTASLEGTGQSSPAIYGGRVFVTSVSGDRKQGCIVACYRLTDGALLWLRTFDATHEIELSNMVSRGAPTPWVDGDGVFAFFESGDVHALDHDGNLRWRRSLVSDYGPFEGNHGIGSSPVAFGANLCLLVDHAGPSYVLGLDKASGKTAWRTEREPRVSWSSPVLRQGAGASELVVSSNGSLDGYDPATGELRWRLEGIVGNTVPSPTVWGDQVLVGASKGPGCALVEVGGADSQQARLRWTAEGARPSGFGSPLVAGELALVVNKSGTLFGVSMESGEVLFDQRLAEGCWASPLYADERVYCFGKGGITSVLRLRGAEGAELVAENKLEPEGAVVGVAVASGHVVIREESRLVCVTGGEPAGGEEESTGD